MSRHLPSSLPKSTTQILDKVIEKRIKSMYLPDSGTDTTVSTSSQLWKVCTIQGYIFNTRAVRIYEQILENEVNHFTVDDTEMEWTKLNTESKRWLPFHHNLVDKDFTIIDYIIPIA